MGDRGFFKFKDEETEDTEYDSGEEEAQDQEQAFHWFDGFKIEWWKYLILLCGFGLIFVPPLSRKYELRITFEKQSSHPIFDESSYLCPAQGLDVQEAKLRLKRMIEEESPEYNASKWKCPQGRRGLISPLPKGIKSTQEILHERCMKLLPCDVNSAVKIALKRLRKEFPIDPIDERMMLGSFDHIHRYQTDYCQRMVDEYCYEVFTIPPCDIIEELVDYGHGLVRVPCRDEPLFGAYGPPAGMDVLQCDVFLKEKR